MSLLLPENIPLSLYIHFPWCIKKCPYCDFNSHTLSQTLPEDDYIDALIGDFQQDIALYGNTRPIRSIFMGGGTPSLFSGKAIKRLLNALQNEIAFHQDIEITLEANPGTIEHDTFDNYADAGINRVSLGAQTFSEVQLKQIGRIHEAQNTIDAMHKIKNSGIVNVNVDLMFALPKQSLSQSIDDVMQAIALQPTHLSLYQFTLEPNTYFSKFPPSMLDGDAAYDIQQTLISVAQDKGYERYEISAYSLPDKKCQHNINYWLFGDYIGIGAGAHGKITHNTGITRSQKIKHPTHYLQKRSKGDNIGLTQQIAPDTIIFEFMMNALRIKSGFTLDVAASRCGISQDTILHSMQPFIDQQLIHHGNNTLSCTEKGYLFLDSILQALLPDEKTA